METPIPATGKRMRRFAVLLLMLYAVLVAFAAQAQLGTHVSVSGIIANTGGNPVSIFFTNGDSITNQSVTTDTLGFYSVVVTANDSSGILLVYFLDCEGNLVDTLFQYQPGIAAVLFNADYCPALGTPVCLSSFTVYYDSLLQMIVLRVDSVVQQNAVLYSWSFGSGDTLNQYFPVYSYAMPGTYNVCLTVTEADGQMCIGCQQITIDSAGQSVTAVPFTLLFSSAIQPEQPLMFDLYPNPASTNAVLQLNVEQAGPVLMYIYNSTGAVVETRIHNARPGITAITIPANQLPPGMYLIRISNGTRVGTMRLVKQ